MSKICQVTGKIPQSGNNVSHAKNRTKRKFFPNLHTHKFWVESENRFVNLKVSAKGMRIIDKKGIAFNEKSVLKRYEIRRKSMNFLMLKSMDFFVDLFGSENLYLRLIRNLGISSVNKSKFMKAFFIRHASGMNKF